MTTVKHGHAMSAGASRLYRIWCGMKARCTNRNSPAFKYYGAKGISVCSEWLSFSVFVLWAKANGYNDTLMIDRIDNSKGYFRENCRWVDAGVSSRNRTTAINITAFGETKGRKEWVSDHRCVVTWAALRHRLEAGWKPEDALSVPTWAMPRKKKTRQPKAPRQFKLTNEVLGRVKSLLCSGMKQRDIAAEVGISKSYVNLINCGKYQTAPACEHFKEKTSD